MAFNTKERFAELDVFRALAIIPIMLCHYPGEALTRETNWNQAYLPIPFSYGSYGVQMFFMISGFTIFFTLNKIQRPTDFLILRFSRLYPAFWCAILLSVFAGEVLGLAGWKHTAAEILLNLTMLHRFFLVPSIDPPHWYLTFEIMLYGLMFLFFITRLTRKIDTVCGFWLALQFMAWVAEQQGWLILSAREKGFLLLEFANLFIAGIIFYQIKFYRGTICRWGLIAGCLAVQWLTTSSSLSLAVTLYFFLFTLFISGHLKFILWRPLIFIGTISYSIFLIHNNLGLAIMQNLYHAGINLTLSIFINIAVIIALASLITFYVEKPAMIAIRNLYKKAYQPPATTS